MAVLKTLVSFVLLDANLTPQNITIQLAFKPKIIIKLEKNFIKGEKEYLQFQLSG